MPEANAVRKISYRYFTMKKKTLFLSIFIILFIISTQLFCQKETRSTSANGPRGKGDIVTEKAFPSVVFESLRGSTFALPHNEAALLLFCFEKECATQARDWVLSIRKEKLLPEAINLYIVPVVGNSLKAKLLKPFIISALKRRIPHDDHEKVALLIQDGKMLKEFIAYEEQNGDQVYLVLLDKKSMVLWQHSGKLTTENKSELKKMAHSLKGS